MKTEVVGNEYILSNDIDTSTYHLYLNLNVDGYVPDFVYRGLVGFKHTDTIFDEIRPYHEYVRVLLSKYNNYTKENSYYRSEQGLNASANIFTEYFKDNRYFNLNNSFIIDDKFDILFAVYVKKDSDIKYDHREKTFIKVNPRHHFSQDIIGEYCIFMDPILLTKEYRPVWNFYKDIYKELKELVHTKIVMMHKSKITNHLVFNPELTRENVNNLTSILFGKQEQN